MKKLILLSLFYSLSFFASAQTVNTKGLSVVQPTTEQKPTGKTYALVVGISDYKYVHPLNYATEDALLFYQFLRSHAGGDVPAPNIKFLNDEEATSASIWHNGISWLQQQKPAVGDKIFIYFSGHGDAVDAQEAYFLAYDANPAGDKNLYASTGTVDIEKLKNRIRDFTTNGVEVILVIDACRTADIPGGKTGLGDYQSVIEKNVGEQLLLSASPNQVAIEDKRWGGGHGVFSWYLINGLAGKADDDKDGKVSFDELKTYVSTHVKADTKIMGSLQTPFYCCNTMDANTIAKVDNDFQKQIDNKQLQGADAISQQLVATRAVSNELNLTDENLRNNYFLLKKYCQLKSKIGIERADSVYNTLTKKYDEKTLQPIADFYVSKMLDEVQVALNRIMQDEDLDTLKWKEKNYYAAHHNLLNKSVAMLKAKGDTALVKQLEQRLLYLKVKSFYIENSHIGSDGTYIQYHQDGKLITDYEFKPIYENIKLLTKSIKMGYNYANVNYEIANQYFTINKWDSAIYFYKIAIQLAPNWVLPYEELSNCYFNIHQNSESVKYMNKWAELMPDKIEPYQNLATFYDVYQRDSILLKLNYKKVLKIDSLNDEALRGLFREYCFVEKNWDSTLFYFNKYRLHQRKLEKEKQVGSFQSIQSYGCDNIGILCYFPIIKSFLKKETHKQILHLTHQLLKTGDTSLFYMAFEYLNARFFEKNNQLANEIKNNAFQYRKNHLIDFYQIPQWYTLYSIDTSIAWWYIVNLNFLENNYFAKFEDEITKEAIESNSKNVKLNEAIANYFGKKKDYKTANQFRLKILQTDSNNCFNIIVMADNYLAINDTINAMNILESNAIKKANYSESNFYVAKLFARCHSKQNCLYHLTKAFDEGYVPEKPIIDEPNFTAYKNDADFLALIKKYEQKK